MFAFSFFSTWWKITKEGYYLFSKWCFSFTERRPGFLVTCKCYSTFCNNSILPYYIFVLDFLHYECLLFSSVEIHARHYFNILSDYQNNGLKPLYSIMCNKKEGEGKLVQTESKIPSINNALFINGSLLILL